MKLGKNKNKEVELEKAKKLIEEAAELEKLKEEQAEPTNVIHANQQAVPQPATEPARKPSKEEIEQIRESVEYYKANYQGLFNPNDSPIQSINPMDSEIASLLFGILQELRQIKEAVKE